MNLQTTTQPRRVLRGVIWTVALIGLGITVLFTTWPGARLETMGFFHRTPFMVRCWGARYLGIELPGQGSEEVNGLKVSWTTEKNGWWADRKVGVQIECASSQGLLHATLYSGVDRDGDRTIRKDEWVLAEQESSRTVGELSSVILPPAVLKDGPVAWRVVIEARAFGIYYVQQGDQGYKYEDP